MWNTSLEPVCPVHHPVHHHHQNRRSKSAMYYHNNEKDSTNTNATNTSSFIHHYRICPMREHLMMMNHHHRHRNNRSSPSLNRLNNRLLSQSTLSLRSCHHGIRTSPISFSNSEHHHSNRHDSSLSSTTTSYDHHTSDQNEDDVVHFVPIIKIHDQQAIRTGEFHPNGQYYAVGSNSKLLRIYPYQRFTDKSDSTTNNNNQLPNEIYTRTNYHRGSIYCLTWNKLGNLLATGSNDKMVKILPFNQETGSCPTNEIDINAHDGTIRDLCFMDDITNGSSLLLSGGAGDCKIYITDCETGTAFLSLSGHSAPILSMYTWGGAMFVSGSQDRTIRFWDLRTNSCINFVTCPTISRNRPGGAVAAVCVDPSGKLLVSGHEDSTCMLYDMRGGRVIQTFHPHSADIRTIRFSNKAYYLLTGGYDNNIVLTDLQGDLTQPLQSIPIASHDDKIIQCRWHPNEFSFISTSADKSAIIWTLPDDDDVVVDDHNQLT